MGFDKDLDPMIGELIEARLPGSSELLCLLRVRCRTGRDFVLSVPPTMCSAREANAWTYALAPEDYQLEART